jgi:DNA replication protein DnaC
VGRSGSARAGSRKPSATGCRAGHRVRFIKVAKLLLALRQALADHTFERELHTWLAPDLLLLDDFGLRKLTAQESGDFYDVLVERDRRAATVITILWNHRVNLLRVGGGV